jgi:hypothetical protein
MACFSWPSTTLNNASQRCLCAKSFPIIGRDYSSPVNGLVVAALLAGIVFSIITIIDDVDVSMTCM